ncbi:ABC transporter permease [Pantoea sp. Eser]|nr:ABC transporter permease [Pantoea sp. Eser]
MPALSSNGRSPMEISKPQPATPPDAPKRWHNPLMVPLKPVAARLRIGLGIAFFVLFVAVWALVTLGGMVSPTFLADPITMLQQGVTLFTEYNFALDIGMTVMRVLSGFVLAAAIAVPLCIMMGAFKTWEAFLESFVSFCRYLPASAFVPLLILWAGIGELQKILVIFIGSFFQIVLMVVTVSSARRDLVEAAYTLGCSNRSIVRRVLGWAWTYVIVAELIGSESGIGHVIVDSQALLNTGKIIFGIIVIGLIGLLSDYLFKRVNRRLFAWS